MLDNGAAGTPSGLPSYIAYFRYANIQPGLRPSNHSFVSIGNGTVPSLGIATVRMPLGLHIYIDFETDIVAQYIPLMFGLDQHKKRQCSSDEFFSTITHHPSKNTMPVTFKKGHIFVEWPQTEVLFTRRELKTLHDRFGHPSSKALLNVLELARSNDFEQETKALFEDLTKRCAVCKTFASKPVAFKVSMPVDDIVFNHEVEVDLFWIESSTVLHIIDRGTRYSVAKFVRSQSSEYIWNTIIDIWVTALSGFPNIISHDQGSCFTAHYFQSCCTECGIICK